VSLYVESVGTGPNLVLLHGWAMHSGMWGPALQPLAKHFRLHLVDLPGHGFSKTEATEMRGCGLARMTEMIADILPTDCIVCGWSLGGQIAIELALQASYHVRKVVLISTTPCFTKREDWQWGIEAGMLQLFLENLKRDYRNTMLRFLTLQVGGSDDTTRVLPELRKGLFERGEPDEASLEAGIQVLLTTDLREKLKNVTQPALLLHGGKDVITHPESAIWAKQQLHCSELLMLPSCGHAPFLSFPEEFAASIIRFAA
jgi:pimeloyl-[acyl-carrier protein] methyl ester esterase